MSRTLRLTSPLTEGEDVKQLQRDINAAYERWGVPHKVDVDGVYGPHTRDELQTVMYGLGIAQESLERGATPYLRVKVRRRLLTPAERARFHARAGWRKRLVKRFSGHGPAAALEWARKQVGVTENPPGSNRGRLIDQWQRLCGILAAPWCGCFVNRALMEAGFPAQPWLRYCPTIEAKARAGEGGWSWHPARECRAGDLPLYGVREAVHVGIAKGFQDDYEGNTSNGPGGSQANGGIVAHRTDRDWSASAFPCRGVARPPYQKVAA